MRKNEKKYLLKLCNQYLSLSFIQLFIVLLCDNYQEFNTSFTTLNLTISNASFENVTHNGTHQILFKDFVLNALWTFAFNWSSNSTKILEAIK
ncbi:CLUMA_CG009379, isoform A [Clunio marinus]|uniref:CLUMA_CG009379, isoform A n=1 Tax=Clunio marinus TaxID=568069 RepID=A0A1J1IAF1_9DIPT|nr:CLUMA_CG009379, isoform A [Clunio marinus]